eukprot:TRINITY_DN3445_c0_g1_i1.p1 TRINITY_DN3445_c0_g1~~TRINITY_DN3445_c0_g1_i1.p1  ORF type:complete len:363 (+),score=115.75 TRINITY_DN3445_c0_g1_i1:161-1090(+)
MSPRKLLLTDKSNKMLVLTPDKKNVLTRIDTETGKTLDEIKMRLHAELDEPINTVTHSEKFSQLLSQPVVELAGTSRNTVFDMTWDPREKTDDIIIGAENRYTKAAKGFNFTAVATTGEGNVITADTDGHIRLFQKSKMKRPKNVLNQLADPILGVDVSKDGEWALWTTKEYLAVAKLSFQDKNADMVSGFEKVFSEKPEALILRIPEDDLDEFNIKEVNFTPARFDNGPYAGSGVIEQEIVTSTGPYIVRWKFRQVKMDYNKERLQDGKSRPTIYKQRGDVVDKAFEYGQNNLVAALDEEFNTLHLGD